VAAALTADADKPDADGVDGRSGEEAGLLWSGRGAGLDVDRAGRQRGAADFEEGSAIQGIQGGRILHPRVAGASDRSSLTIDSQPVTACHFCQPRQGARGHVVADAEPRPTMGWRAAPWHDSMMA
jgi:hypothetical protein